MLSCRGKYATRALLDLTLHGQGGPVQIHDIAARQHIPVKFLEQILLTLKRSGFVKSRKGPGGGYLLAMPPTAITLGAVVRATDGPLAPISCVSTTDYNECGCPEPLTCSLRTAWKEARDALAKVLDTTTFAHLAERHGSLQAQQNELVDYVI